MLLGSQFFGIVAKLYIFFQTGKTHCNYEKCFNYVHVILLF